MQLAMFLKHQLAITACLAVCCSLEPRPLPFRLRKNLCGRPGFKANPVHGTCLISLDSSNFDLAALVADAWCSTDCFKTKLERIKKLLEAYYASSHRLRQ